MNSTELDSDSPVDEASTAASEGGPDEAAEKKIPLQLEIEVTSPSTCQRHVMVTVSREDIDRYFKNAIKDLLPKAEVPGFRPGRAPRKLIESRFREQVQDQVKGALLMDSMAQISETEQFTAISEPSFNLDAVIMPETGPLKYEFDIEVRPNFDLPEWKGLELKRPVYTYSDEEVERQLARVLERFGVKGPVPGPVVALDYVTVRAEFSFDGNVVSRHNELELHVRPTLSFRDARIEDGLGLLVGANVGDRREGKAKVGEGTDSPYAGREATVTLEILDIKRVELPEMTPVFLEALGGFESREELQAFLRGELEQQFRYHQQRDMRRQITTTLTAGANWDLPPDMLRRQSKRELDRMVLELKSNGFNDEQIRAYSNQLRQNSQAATRTALKEHFILEKIAEQESIDALPDDYDVEVKLIADQSDESERRVRARLEKRGMMDTLRNQIVERKVIELITAAASVVDVPFEKPAQPEFAVDVAVTTAAEESEIPEAKHGESGGDTLMPAAEKQK